MAGFDRFPFWRDVALVALFLKTIQGPSRAPAKMPLFQQGLGWNPHPKWVIGWWLECSRWLIINLRSQAWHNSWEMVIRHWSVPSIEWHGFEVATTQLPWLAHPPWPQTESFFGISIKKNKKGLWTWKANQFNIFQHPFHTLHFIYLHLPPNSGFRCIWPIYLIMEVSRFSKLPNWSQGIGQEFCPPLGFGDSQFRSKDFLSIFGSTQHSPKSGRDDETWISELICLNFSHKTVRNTIEIRAVQLP